MHNVEEFFEKSSQSSKHQAYLPALCPDKTAASIWLHIPANLLCMALSIYPPSADLILCHLTLVTCVITPVCTGPNRLRFSSPPIIFTSPQGFGIHTRCLRSAPASSAIALCWSQSLALVSSNGHRLMILQHQVSWGLLGWMVASWTQRIPNPSGIFCSDMGTSDGKGGVPPGVSAQNGHSKNSWSPIVVTGTGEVSCSGAESDSDKRRYRIGPRPMWPQVWEKWYWKAILYALECDENVFSGRDSSVRGHKCSLPHDTNCDSQILWYMTVLRLKVYSWQLSSCSHFSKSTSNNA